MSGIINKIKAEEKKSEQKIIHAQAQARTAIANAQKRANDFLVNAESLSKQDKERIIQEVGQDTLKQIKQIERESKFRLSQIKISETEKQKAVNLIVKNIFND